MTVSRESLQMLSGCALAFTVSVALAGFMGFSQSMRVMKAAPVSRALGAPVVPLPPPVHDPHKPTVAVLLGNTLSEPTDVLGPYAMFAESGEYNVYTVAEDRGVRTLTGRLDLVPHLSFDELAVRLQGDPDIVVVPQIVDIKAQINVPIVTWVRQQGRGRRALLFSWCTGAEVLAESGVIDGKAATAHWGDIDRLEHAYPRVNWQRGVRYVDGGTLLSTAGLTAGVDATLHLLARRHGVERAAKVAQSLRIPPSPFLEDPKCRQYEFGLADTIFLLNAGFRWPKPRLSVWLRDGVGELDLGSDVDVYGVSAAYQIDTLSDAASVVSRHGIQFVPRQRVQAALLGGDPGAMLPSEGSREFAYVSAVEDLARREDVWTAKFAAKRLEIRTPLRIQRDPWPIRVILTPVFIGCAAVAFLFWLKRRTLPKKGLELKVPPVALGLITMALMWCAAWAAPDLDFRFPPNAVLSAVLAVFGLLTCVAGVVSFRRAKTTVNPMKPASTSSLVISGIYGCTRNPMYLGFLLLLAAWAVALSNVLALAWLPVFVLYMNRFQILPEERVLASRFAQDYEGYCAGVRRWL